MDERDITGLPFADAICYSGYREGQSPGDGSYPSEAEILEDLRLLEGHWKYLRLYDCSTHAARVLAVIHREKLDFQVLIGAEARAEHSNPNCPWGASYTREQLAANREHNRAENDRAIAFANDYRDIVCAASIGNEASVSWTDHLVPVPRLVERARRLRRNITQPVTFCENYVPWRRKLAPLVEVVDFISVHSYPIWEYKTIQEALEYTKDNYYSVVKRHPGKPVIISEAGWCTRSNGRGMEPWNASQELQAIYYEQLMDWTRKAKILCFTFEAFDEPWKGSDDPDEPEKHWGLFTVDRRPKLVMREKFPELVAPRR